MKKLISGGLAAATATGALLLGAAPAHAEGFLSLPLGTLRSSHLGDLLPFADNVRYSYFTQPGQVVTAYSPVTGQYYTM